MHVGWVDLRWHRVQDLEQQRADLGGMVALGVAYLGGCLTVRGVLDQTHATCSSSGFSGQVNTIACRCQALAGKSIQQLRLQWAGQYNSLQVLGVPRHSMSMKLLLEPWDAWWPMSSDARLVKQALRQYLDCFTCFWLETKLAAWSCQGQQGLSESTHQGRHWPPCPQR